MKFSRIFLLYAGCLLAVTTCGLKRKEPAKPIFENHVDTRNKSIEIQTKREYRFDHKKIIVDNLFDGARLNNARMAGNTLSLTISPENIPINGSAWYAFRITSQKKQQLIIELNYSYGTHRYAPKWSHNGKIWTAIDQRKIKISTAGDKARFMVNVPNGTLWIAAQEIIGSKQVMNWCNELSRNAMVHSSSIGKSARGKEIPCLDIYTGDVQPKQAIVILGRHHPPEVTGHFALEAFVERLLKHKQANEFFKRYRVLVFPLMNPDGVDLGHWRHNAQGIDLNRDYAEYNQPEIKGLASYLTGLEKVEILMGLDFHSTYEDVYYTNLETEGVELAGLEADWLKNIERRLRQYNYRINQEKHSVNSNPSSQHWFYHQFRALGLTYEIGDNTPRDFIKVKAHASADALLEQLINR